MSGKPHRNLNYKDQARSNNALSRRSFRTNPQEAAEDNSYELSPSATATASNSLSVLTAEAITVVGSGIRQTESETEGLQRVLDEAGENTWNQPTATPHRTGTIPSDSEEDLPYFAISSLGGRIKHHSRVAFGIFFSVLLVAGLWLLFSFWDSIDYYLLRWLVLGLFLVAAILYCIVVGIRERRSGSTASDNNPAEAAVAPREESEAQRVYMAAIEDRNLAEAIARSQRVPQNTHGQEYVIEA